MPDTKPDEEREGQAEDEDRADPNETASAEIEESLATESNLPDPPPEWVDEKSDKPSV